MLGKGKITRKVGLCPRSRRTRRTLADPFAHSSMPPEGERAEIRDARSATRPLVAQKKHNTPPYDPPRDGALDEGADPPPSLSF